MFAVSYFVSEVFKEHSRSLRAIQKFCFWHKNVAKLIKLPYAVCGVMH